MPQRELKRLQAVNRFLTLQIDKDQNLQEIAEIAAELCETPIALISLYEGERQHYRYKVGTDIEYRMREDTFCNYLKNDLMIVEDALLDERFANNIHVSNEPFVRFYAGIPLITHDGHVLGSLSVIDTKPNRINEPQKHLLQVLSKRIIQIMEFEFSLKILKEQYLQAKDSEIKLRSFFESGNSCHLLISKDLKAIAFNKNMADFIARIYNIKLYAGINISDVLSGAALDRFIDECKTALNGTPLRYEREVKYPNETIWWATVFDPGYNDEGEIIGISFNAYDITERVLHEKQIITQNASLKSIAYIQSHELRRPVASILGLMEIFKNNNYVATADELKILDAATVELDDKIRDIVNFTQGNGE